MKLPQRDRTSGSPSSDLGLITIWLSLSAGNASPGDMRLASYPVPGAKVCLGLKEARVLIRNTKFMRRCDGNVLPHNSVMFHPGLPRVGLGSVQGRFDTVPF